MAGTKVDIINGAYSQMRISGLTVVPGAADNELALEVIESMAAEYEGNNICVGYNFEDTPDVNSLHNMEREFWFAFESCLAVRLSPNFGKAVPDSLLKNQRAGYSFLSSRTAPTRETQYPSRQPRGSGSTLRYNRWERFYRPQAEAPLESATHTMFIDDIDDFVEHFDAYLDDSETISSFTITVDTGLVVVSSSNTDEDVIYQIRADGNDGTKNDALLQVKIIVTTSDSRIQTRIINFSLVEPEL